MMPASTGSSPIWAKSSTAWNALRNSVMITRSPPTASTAIRPAAGSPSCRLRNVPVTPTGPLTRSSTLAPTVTLTCSPGCAANSSSMPTASNTEATYVTGAPGPVRSARSSNRANVQVTSPEPPAPGLSPESLTRYGPARPAARCASAVSIASSNVPVGAAKSTSSRTRHSATASSSPAAATGPAEDPVTSTVAWQRGSSAQAYPTQMPASVTPSRADTYGIRPYRLRAGSTRVEV